MYFDKEAHVTALPTYCNHEMRKDFCTFSEVRMHKSKHLQFTDSMCNVKYLQKIKMKEKVDWIS